jgi:hypothetical protein
MDTPSVILVYIKYEGRMQTSILKQEKIIIVGAGIVGLSTALALLQRGIENVTVVEQNSVGHVRAASRGVSRLLRFEYGADRFYTGMVQAPEFVERIQASIDAIASYCSVNEELNYPSLENGWNTLNQWCDNLFKAERFFHDAASSQAFKEIIRNLARKVEQQRLAFSSRQFADRYKTKIVEGQQVNDEISMSKGTFYVRSEVKDIHQSYFQTPEYREEVERNDSHWGYPDPEFEKSCYRNAYNPATGELIVVANYRNRDALKKPDSPTMYNSEILLHHMIAIVKHTGGDPTLLKLTKLTLDAVTNKETLKVVAKYVELGETKSFFPASKAFQELLKTPNCRSRRNLIKNYRYLLGDKEITSIQVKHRPHKIHGNIADIMLHWSVH